MAQQTLLVTLPDNFYQRLKVRAEQAQHSIEDELVTLAAAALEDEPTPLDIQEAVALLPVLDDTALWQAARSRLPQAESDEVEEMHFKQQREGLTGAEKQRLAGLMHQYEKALLIRSHALLLLKQRGQDITKIEARMPPCFNWGMKGLRPLALPCLLWYT
jgi:plasmid stability protein